MNETETSEIKVLVTVTAYPDPSGVVPLMYVHTRNIFYKTQGINVAVLNFSTKENYIIDDIPVIALKTYMTEKRNYNILICHAANLRNHYVFLHKCVLINKEAYDKMVKTNNPYGDGERIES